MVTSSALLSFTFFFSFAALLKAWAIGGRRLVLASGPRYALAAGPGAAVAATGPRWLQAATAWLPDPETLDKLAFRMVLIGFPLWTFGVMMGAVWGEHAWGRWWGNDPKEIMAAVTWIVYAIYFHARAIGGMRGYRTTAIASLGLRLGPGHLLLRQPLDRRPPLLRALAGLVLAGAVAGASGCSLVQPLTGARQSLATVGKPAPDFTGTDLDGKQVRLSSYRGHPVLLNFWASWCGPCRAEQPGLNAVAADYAARGVRVLGVVVRDNLASARIYRDEFKVPYRSLFDQAARLAYAYQVDAPPSSVFIDAGGIVRFKLTGELDQAAIRQIIDQRLLGNG